MTLSMYNRPRRRTVVVSQSSDHLFVCLRNLPSVVRLVFQNILYVAMFQETKTSVAAYWRQGEFFLQRTSCKFVVVCISTFYHHTNIARRFNSNYVYGRRNRGVQGVHVPPTFSGRGVQEGTLCESLCVSRCAVNGFVPF